MNILVIGGIAWDTIIQVDEFISPKPQTYFCKHSYEALGSTGAGKALNLAYLNHDVVLHALVGDDEAGKKVINELDKHPLTFIHNKSSVTTTHTNIMNAKGERISIYTNMEQLDDCLDLELMAALIEKCDVVVLNIIEYALKYASLIQASTKPVFVDIHDYTPNNPYHQPFIDLADIIQLSSDNLDDYKMVMQDLMRPHKQLIICTHGSKGCTILDENGFKDYEISAVEVVDSNGAGDAFSAGFIDSYYRFNDLDQAIKKAQLVSEMCVRSQQLFNEGIEHL